MHIVEGPAQKKEEKNLFEGNDWRLLTSMNDVEKARITLMERLRKNGWNEDDVQNILFGFHEALNNAVAHGNLGIKGKEGERSISELVRHQLEQYPKLGKKEIHVFIDENDNSISITVQDEGNGFDTKSINDPTQKDNLFKGEGRGIFLMKNFFDSVEFDEKGNEVTMVKLKKNQES